MDANTENKGFKINTKEKPNNPSKKLNDDESYSQYQQGRDYQDVDNDDDNYEDYNDEEEDENLYDRITERNSNQSKTQQQQPQQQYQQHQINDSDPIERSNHLTLPTSASDNSLLIIDNLDHSLDNVEVELTPMPSIITSPFHRVMNISRVTTPVTIIHSTDYNHINNTHLENHHNNNNNSTSNAWQLTPPKPLSTTPRILMDFLNMSSHDVTNTATSRSRRSMMTKESVSTHDKLTTINTTDTAIPNTAIIAAKGSSSSSSPPQVKLAKNNNMPKSSNPSSSNKSSSHATSVEDDYENELKSSITNANTDNNDNNNGDYQPTDATTVSLAHGNNNPAVIPLHERHRYEFYTIIAGGVALAFNSGLINGITLQARGIPVSHVTGTTSHAGMSLAQHDDDNAAIYLALITCFIFGSMITGLLMPSNSFKLGGQYGPLFVIGSLLLMIACVIAYERPDSYWYFYLASMSSGLQNGITTKYSGSIIRTTHVTGSATDIGLVIGRLIKGDRKELWKLKVLVPLFLGFLLGSFASIKTYAHFGKLSLMINVLIFFTIGLLYSFMIRLKLSVPLWRVLFGMYRIVDQTSELGKEGINNAAKNVTKISKVMKVKIKKMNKTIVATSSQVNVASIIRNPLHSSSSAAAASSSQSTSKADGSMKRMKKKQATKRNDNQTAANDYDDDDVGVEGFADDNYLE